MTRTSPLEDERRVETLPAVPLSATDLASILDKEFIVEVLVPSHPDSSVRGDSVLMGGESSPHDGYIYKFWIEFEDRYRAVEYVADLSGTGGVWYRSAAPLEKDA
jgi:hypothetical protein